MKGQAIIFNTILFLYQFEFLSNNENGIILSVYRVGILPLLTFYLIRYHGQLIKQDTWKYITILLFYSFSIISLIGYGYIDQLTVFIGNFIQLLVAYFFFRKNRMQKSSFWILSTWGLFQLPFFINALILGELNLSHRFLGFHWDPNYLCMSLLISFWAKIYLLRGKLNRSLKLITILLSFTDILMILFSLSRGGLFALIFSVGLYTFFYRKKLFFILSVTILSLISYMMARAQWVVWNDSLSLMDMIIYRTFVTAETTGDISSYRIDFIANYINMIKQGDGIYYGTTLLHFIEKVNGGMYPHNSIIEILLHAGLIVGGLFYTVFTVQILKIFYYSFRFKVLPFEFLFLISGLCVLMFLSFGLKICWIFIGMAFSISNKNCFAKNYQINL